MLRGVGAIIFGVLLIVGSSIGLFWNEGRAVQTARSLAEGRGLVVDVGTAHVDPEHEGKLIHISGDVQAKAALRDPQFGVTANGLRLVRDVEMYQWKEELAKRSAGNSTDTHDYVRVWSRSRIDSSHFRRREGHENPEMRFARAAFSANDASLGAFHPSERALGSLAAKDPIQITSATAEGLRGRISGPVHEFDGRLYLGPDPNQPRIGDLRIRFSIAPNGPASFIARQSGTGLTEYQTKSGDRLLIARSGFIAAPEMFSSAEQQNRLTTWILRVVGAFAMFIGFAVLLSPLSSVASFIPFVGGLVAVAGALVAAMLTALLAPTIVAIAWLWYRPVVSIVVLLVGLGVAFGLKNLASQKVAQQSPA